ncbi:MAG: hypothetical protein JEY96_08915 [Bacteroidales bacterium]|nr:hypothetical protein [Bacteroidales bacterium]
MKRKQLNKKLEISTEALTNLEQEQVKGAAAGCYNTTSAMRVHSYCVPATKLSVASSFE